MNSRRPAIKVGIISLGFLVALGLSWVAVAIHQRATSGPDAQASSGMYAFGDLVIGVAVFSGVALAPLALALYWLRPVGIFWRLLTGFAMAYAATGIWAVGLNAWPNHFPSGWPLLLSHVRFGLMPLSALALLMCAVFAPEKRHRWPILAAAVIDGALFAAVVVAKFILPGIEAV